MRNDGAVPGLPDDAVVETTAVVDADGRPPAAAAGPLAPEMLGLVQHAKAYERLAVKAACSGSRDDVVRALLANPLVGPVPVGGRAGRRAPGGQPAPPAPVLPVVIEGRGSTRGRLSSSSQRCAGKTGRRRVPHLPHDPRPLPARHLRSSLVAIGRWRSRDGPSCRDRHRRGGGAAAGRQGPRQLPSWRWEELRTTLWVVPSISSSSRSCCSSSPSRSTWRRSTVTWTLPFWIRTGSADAERQVLIAIAAAVITVIGVVFSITILALTLASQQFGPRMMRNFVRDIGNQVTLGVFVGTFVYSVLALGLHQQREPGPSSRICPPRSPRPSCWSTSAVLIYFIHHIAKSIQLPEVIAGIAHDLIELRSTPSSRTRWVRQRACRAPRTPGSRCPNC